jgi:hypothetical protein
LIISLEDCVGLSGLTEEEILAIAEHEHIPEMAASALGHYLSRQARGIEQIRDMIVHDIRQAQQGQDKQQASFDRIRYRRRDPACSGAPRPDRAERRRPAA